jgi:hypothetical protein
MRGNFICTFTSCLGFTGRRMLRPYGTWARLGLEDFAKESVNGARGAFTSKASGLKTRATLKAKARCRAEARRYEGKRQRAARVMLLHWVAEEVGDGD